jgi:hypothetical protein
MLSTRGTVLGCAVVDPALFNRRPTGVGSLLLWTLVPSLWEGPLASDLQARDYHVKTVQKMRTTSYRVLRANGSH